MRARITCEHNSLVLTPLDCPYDKEMCKVEGRFNKYQCPHYNNKTIMFLYDIPGGPTTPIKCMTNSVRFIKE